MNHTRISAAQQRLQGHARVTPLLSSPFVDRLAGRRVLIKAECLQHTGSFKYRGARAAISALSPDVRAQGILAYSSGNHAQAIAYVASEFGVPAVIVMPGDAPAIKLANTRAYGAEVIPFDADKEETRETLGAQIQAERDLTLIKPFDNPEVIAGQASVGLEIAEQAGTFGVERAEVLTCCGGGGLSAGIALALEARAPGMRVRVVEPAGFDDVARSLGSGKIEHNTHARGSICDAILTSAPGELTFPILARLSHPGLTVSDDECMEAMAVAWDRLKLVVEPGGAVALAAALFRSDQIQGDTVIVVLSGGNVDSALFARVLTESRYLREKGAPS